MKRVLASLILCLLCLACGNDKSTSPSPRTLGPAGSLYVLNQTDATIYVYDSRTGARTDSLAAEVPAPHHIEFSPDHQFFYVVSRSTPGQVAKFAAADNSFLQKFTTDGTVFPTAIAATASGLYGYLADFTSSTASGKLLKYDLSTMTLANGDIQSGSGTHDVKLTHDGATVIACNRFTDDLTIVNTATDEVNIVSLNENDPSLPGQPKYGPYGVTIDPNDSLAYVACLDSTADQVRIFDIGSRQVVDSIMIPFDKSLEGPGKFAGPTLVAMTSTGSQLWVTTYWGSSVVVVNPATKAILADIPLATPAAFGVSLSDDNTRAYVACANVPGQPGSVYIIDTHSFAKVDSLDVGKNSYMVHYHPKHS